MTNPPRPKAKQPPKQPTFRRTFIAQWREHRGLTQAQVAAAIEMRPSHLSMLERGLRGYTQGTLEAIAQALGTDAGSLLSRAPSEDDALWAAWREASPGEKETLIEIAQSVVRRRGH